VIEAQGFGVPVITSNRSCLPEIVGDSGILIDPEDPAALAEAMHRLIDDGKMHIELVKKALDNSRQFSWRTAADQPIQVYRSVLGY